MSHNAPKQIATFLSALMLAFDGLSQSVPSLINYQGKLTAPSGVPFGSANYDIQFRLWDSTTGTATNGLIWAQQQSVAVQANGVFNVTLGSPEGSAIVGIIPAFSELGSAFASSNRFLGVTVVSSNGVALSPVEILPRQQLMSVPFSIQAQIAGSLVADLAAALCPAGSIIAFGGATIPNGWLLCDGSAVSSGQYPRLYTAISTNWGAGLQASTNNFNLPDLRGLFLRGVNGTRTNFTQMGTNLVDADSLLRTNWITGGNTGNNVGSFQDDGFKRHTHTIQRSDTGGIGSPSNWIGANNWTGGQIPNFGNVINDTGGAETRSKNAYVNYIIKY